MRSLKTRGVPYIHFRRERDRETGEWVWDYTIHEIRWPVFKTVPLSQLRKANVFLQHLNRTYKG